MRKIIFLFVLFQTNLLQAQSVLNGQWFRIDDDLNNPESWEGENYDSMIVEVVEKDSSWVGIMHKVPKNAVDHGYSVGQIKWRNLKKPVRINMSLKGF